MIKRFNRYELKYIIPVATRDAVLEELLLHVDPDREGDKNGVYKVTSLYYDTPDLQFYRSKLDGIKYRRKVRIRQYGEFTTEPDPRVMIEIKQRINRTTQKRRLALKRSEAYALCAGELARQFEDRGDAAVASEVEYLVKTLFLKPSCLVGYVRRAFMGRAYEPGLRVTFDELLWCGTPAMGLTDAVPHHSIMELSHVVMEVKANDAVPLWLSLLLARKDCALDRFSKYCAGVARLLAGEDRYLIAPTGAIHG
ncbi:MAG: polyphosphate polymerase domain-containing protein [Deltaproteobacteria bacterium]|nr:polyphosphate polymerase domain-containing protein [Deltaproteobacteria bacterium]